jgi:hypothetical protein
MMVKHINNIKAYAAKNKLVSNQDEISYKVELVCKVSGAFSSAMPCLQTTVQPRNIRTQNVPLSVMVLFVLLKATQSICFFMPGLLKHTN